MLLGFITNLLVIRKMQMEQYASVQAKDLEHLTHKWQKTVHKPEVRLLLKSFALHDLSISKHAVLPPKTYYDCQASNHIIQTFNKASVL